MRISVYPCPRWTVSVLIQSHKKGPSALRGATVPFIECVTYCPFETVIDRTATGDSQLNAVRIHCDVPCILMTKIEASKEETNKTVSVWSRGNEELDLCLPAEKQGKLGLTDFPSPEVCFID